MTTATVEQTLASATIAATAISYGWTCTSAVAMTASPGTRLLEQSATAKQASVYFGVTSNDYESKNRKKYCDSKHNCAIHGNYPPRTLEKNIHSQTSS